MERPEWARRFLYVDEEEAWSLRGSTDGSKLFINRVVPVFGVPFGVYPVLVYARTTTGTVLGHYEYEYQGGYET